MIVKPTNCYASFRKLAREKFGLPQPKKPQTMFLCDTCGRVMDQPVHGPMRCLVCSNDPMTVAERAKMIREFKR